MLGLQILNSMWVKQSVLQLLGWWDLEEANGSRVITSQLSVTTRHYYKQSHGIRSELEVFLCVFFWLFG